MPAVSANVSAIGVSLIAGGVGGALTLNVTWTLCGLLVTPLTDEPTKIVAVWAPAVSEVAFAVTVIDAGALVPSSVALSQPAPDA